MKKNIFLFVFFIFIVICNAKFPRKAPIRKKINYSFKIFYKNQKELIETSKDDISEKIIEIVKDDVINDIIYYAKVYNLVNDNEKSYLYIFMYEFLTVFRKNDKNIQISIPLYIANVTTYIIMKTIILNKLIHHINI